MLKDKRNDQRKDKEKNRVRYDSGKGEKTKLHKQERAAAYKKSEKKALDQDHFNFAQKFTQVPAARPYKFAYEYNDRALAPQLVSIPDAQSSNAAKAPQTPLLLPLHRPTMKASYKRDIIQPVRPFNLLASTRSQGRSTPYLLSHSRYTLNTQQDKDFTILVQPSVPTVAEAAINGAMDQNATRIASLLVTQSYSSEDVASTRMIEGELRKR